MKKNVLAAAALLSSFVAACATPALELASPTAITSEKVGKVSEGISRAELLELFGEPEMKIPTGDGMTYFWKDPNLNSLWVLFAEDWTVADYEFSQ